MVDPGVGRGRSRAALLVLALLFFVSLTWLFALRLENGDFLPAYSSLRKDPMGTAVLYESLLKSGLKVERNHDPFSRAVLSPEETLLIIGHRGEFSEVFGDETIRKSVTSFVEQGGRLVITTGRLFSSNPDEESEKTENKECGSDDQEQASQDTTSDDAKSGNESKKTAGKKGDEVAPPAWAVQTGHPESSIENSSEESTHPPPAIGFIDGKALTVVWPDRLVFKEVFKKPGARWQILLTLDDEPVLIERQLGKGTIALATSSFFLSNEAMLRDRQVALLKWLVGSPVRLIFDEFHHGLRSQESIVGLMRSHNLHGVVIALFLLAALFLWKNSSSLLPRYSRQDKPNRHQIGRDQFEGLVNILRLHPPDNLVGVALRQWEKENRKWCDRHPKQIEKMRQLAEMAEQSDTSDKAGDREREQVDRYRAISRILNENNKRTHQRGEL